MCRTKDKIVRYAPLCIYRFRLIVPHRLVDAQLCNQQYHSYEEIEDVPARLKNGNAPSLRSAAGRASDANKTLRVRWRWCRHHMGLMQKEVAEKIGITRGHYTKFESGETDYIPSDVADRLAELFHVPVTDLLDEYNSFLYNGQRKMLLDCRKRLGLNQRAFARLIQVPAATLQIWESGKKRVTKSSWEKYLRDYIKVNEVCS
ncbi:MAG: helix-turn-helix domain-containing protein [Lachnospiraceae bacterium]|nr:helix-turn-helix domain-containing protein [Lachnospiraceae bacterium]